MTLSLYETVAAMNFRKNETNLLKYQKIAVNKLYFPKNIKDSMWDIR